MRSRRWLASVSMLGLGAAVGHFAHTARAGGIQSSRALTYSGTLQDTNGDPLRGSQPIDFRLWDAAKDGEVRCEIINPDEDVQLDRNGRFSIPLPEACATAVSSDRELWVELRVSGSALPRMRLGAVPYALEAQHALVADTATDKSRKIAGIFPYGSKAEDGCISIENSEWKEAPGVFVDVNVDAPVTIWATYSINVQPNAATTSGDWVATRLVVDGVVAPSSASHFQPYSTADANSNINGQHVGELTAGRHTVKLEWATGGLVGWASCTWVSYNGATGGRSLTVLAIYK
jgi:hypothetical protein